MVEDSLIESFKDEFHRLSDNIETIATEFYDDPGTDELEESYRIMHTLKGNCYTAGFEGMGDIVHEFENVLGNLKNNNISPDAEIGDLLLDVNDTLNEMLEEDPETSAPENLIDRINSVTDEQQSTDVSSGDESEESEESQSDSSSQASQALDVEIQEIPVTIERLDDLFRESENLRAELLEEGDKKLVKQASKISRTLLNIRLIRPKKIVPKLKRLVRTTIGELDGKDIDFVVEGENTQASASVIEDLSKVLPHLLKNSIDHGVESKEKREEKGKDPEGNVTLSFEQMSSSFVVKISDDGKGMDPDEIADAAVEKGVVDKSELGQMTSYEKLKLIFESGFSLSEDVTEVSGRGVGMNAVATTVKKYGGRVEIDTEIDEGTTFELHFPVPFQWEEFLLAKLGNQKIGFPVRQIKEVFCLQDQMEPESGMIQADQPLPLIGFEELDPRFGDEIQRPILVLDLAMPVAIAVDDLIGFTGTLILSPPSDSRESYISGIGRDPSGENFWGINLREVSRSINSYMVGM